MPIPGPFRTAPPLRRRQSGQRHVDMAPPEDAASPGAKKENGFGGHITADTKFETSFFMVTVDADGKITKVNHGAVASVSEDEISQYAQTILSSGDRGRVDYRYALYTPADGSRVIVAVNCYQQMRQESTLLLVSSGAGLLCMAAVYVLVLLMSRRVTRPVEESVEKQRQFITDAGHELKRPSPSFRPTPRYCDADRKINGWTASKTRPGG